VGEKRWPVTPADILTLLRLAAVPILWVLAALQLPVHLGVGLALAGLTDVLDGPLARSSGRTTALGGQLDSIADILLMASIVLWMAWLHPGFFRDNLVPLAVWATIGLAAILATWLRFGRIGNLHLYSAKAAGVVGYVFVVWLFVLGDYSRTYFAMAIGLAMLASTETLLVALTRERVDERVRSILSGRR
jgi:cardiolipin synthase (CMP-forming)